MKITGWEWFGAYTLFCLCWFARYYRRTEGRSGWPTIGKWCAEFIYGLAGVWGMPLLALLEYLVAVRKPGRWLWRLVTEYTRWVHYRGRYYFTGPTYGDWVWLYLPSGKVWRIDRQDAAWEPFHALLAEAKAAGWSLDSIGLQLRLAALRVAFGPDL